MDDSWIKVIKVTGLSGLVCYLIFYILQNLFTEKVNSIFGTTKTYYTVVTIIAGLLFLLFLFVIKHQAKEQPPIEHHNTINDIHHNTIQGDFFLGDKIIKKDDKEK